MLLLLFRRLYKITKAQAWHSERVYVFSFSYFPRRALHVGIYGKPAIGDNLKEFVKDNGATSLYRKQ